jgi:hypothetical protein
VTFRGESLIRGIKRVAAAVTVLGATIAVAATPAQAAVSSTPSTTPGFNGTVLAVAYSGSTAYIGGDFTAAVVNGKTVARNRLAAVNALTGQLLPWAPSADRRVKAIAVSGSSVYVAGEFGTISGQKRDSLARLDAATGAVSPTFKHSISGKPYALAAASGRLYLGGGITAVNGQVRSRLAAFNLTTGALDGAWKPAADDQVEAITAAGGRIYVGGKFHKVNGVRGYDRLVALSPTSGAIVTAFKPKATVITYGIAVTTTGVFTATGGQGGRAHSYSTSGSLRWTVAFDGDAQAVAVQGSTVYVGGHFDTACKTPRTGTKGICLDGKDDRVKLAAYDVASGKLLSWTANGNGIEGVLTLAIGPSIGALGAGGAFTTVNGRSQKRFAQFR